MKMEHMAKNRILAVISLKFCFQNKEERFLQGKTFPGDNECVGHPCVNSAQNDPSGHQRKSWLKKPNKIHYLQKNTEPSSFQTTSMHQGICIANVVNKMTTCGLKLLWKTRKTLLDKLTDGKICFKIEFQ